MQVAHTYCWQGCETETRAELARLGLFGAVLHLPSWYCRTNVVVIGAPDLALPHNVEGVVLHRPEQVVEEAA